MRSDKGLTVQDFLYTPVHLAANQVAGVIPKQNSERDFNLIYFKLCKVVSCLYTRQADVDKAYYATAGLQLIVVHVIGNGFKLANNIT